MGLVFVALSAKECPAVVSVRTASESWWVEKKGSANVVLVLVVRRICCVWFHCTFVLLVFWGVFTYNSSCVDLCV